MWDIFIQECHEGYMPYTVADKKKKTWLIKITSEKYANILFYVKMMLLHSNTLVILICHKDQFLEMHNITR